MLCNLSFQNYKECMKNNHIITSDNIYFTFFFLLLLLLLLSSLLLLSLLLFSFICVRKTKKNSFCLIPRGWISEASLYIHSDPEMFPFLSFSLQCHSSVHELMSSIFNPHFSLLLPSLFCITNTRIRRCLYNQRTTLNKIEFFDINFACVFIYVDRWLTSVIRYLFKCKNCKLCETVLSGSKIIN